MFSGDEFAFNDMETEHIPEKLYRSQGQEDPDAASWPELLLNCSNQCSIHCMIECDAVGYILINVSLILHV